MNKNLLTSLLVVGVTASTAFLLYRAWKIGRDMDKHKVTEIEMQAARERVNERLDDTPEEDPEAPGEEYMRPGEVSDVDANSMYPEIDLTLDEEDPEEKEMEKLKYPINSPEALEQFKDMELADFTNRNDKTRLIVMQLFDEPYAPSSEEDDSITSRVMDHRVEFFGDESMWSEECTYADVIMDFARMGSEDLGIPVTDIVKLIVGNLQIDDPNDTDQIKNSLDDLDNGSLVLDRNGRTLFGLFGLSGNEMKAPDESLMQQYWDWSSKMVNF